MREAGGAVAAALAVPMETAARIGRLIDRFGGLDGGQGVDAFVVTDLLNVRYLTGFTGGAGTLVVTPTSATLVTDGRYAEQARSELASAGVDVAVEVDLGDGREPVLAAVGASTRVALEADAVTWSQLRRYADDWFTGRELVPTTHAIEQLRFVKDDGELARIGAAAVLADHVLQATAPMFADGPTELDVQRRLDEQMQALGSQEPAFSTIVASGPNAALAHHRPGERRIQSGDMVLIDFGATVDGYRSDLSRTVAVGEPDPVLAEVFELVLRAQLAGLEAVRDGVAGADVDRASRSIIEAAGRGEQFIHSTGHGVGLYIHEDPFLSWRSDDVLASRHVVTVEPGVYLPGVGGVRIEDLVAVTDDGYELLTHTPKTPTLTT